MPKICAYCGITFETNTDRACCTVRCSKLKGSATRGMPPWTDEEVLFLEELIGTMTFKKVVKTFQKECNPNRTFHAIKSRLYKIPQQFSVKCVDDDFTLAGLARSLGIHQWRLTPFIRNKQLTCTRNASNRLVIKRIKAKKLVMAYPERFSDVSSDRLFWLLENLNDVDWVKAHKFKVMGAPKRVQCIDTGTVYNSVKEAAIAHNIQGCAISMAIANNRRSAGKKWKFV